MPTTLQQSVNAIHWIKTLETTTLKQGTRSLGDSQDGYCCLGIGCVIGKIPFEPGAGASKPFHQSIGLQTMSGHFTTPFVVDEEDKDSPNNALSLIALNDDVPLTFREISEQILLRVDELFTRDVALLINEYYNI